LVGDADGIIGPATLEAVKTFQRGKGMPVDGFPSRTILELLRKEG
jgi:membrane-bound lytic murein transglycosylase B